MIGDLRSQWAGGLSKHSTSTVTEPCPTSSVQVLLLSIHYV